MKSEKELFAEAWLFLYTAAGKNIGFDVKKKERQDNADDDRGADQKSA